MRPYKEVHDELLRIDPIRAEAFTDGDWAYGNELSRYQAGLKFAMGSEDEHKEVEKNIGDEMGKEDKKPARVMPKFRPGDEIHFMYQNRASKMKVLAVRMVECDEAEGRQEAFSAWRSRGSIDYVTSYGTYEEDSVFSSKAALLRSL